MKRALLLLLSAALCLCLSALPASADFSDDCILAQDDGWHAYRNLSATAAGPAVDFDWSAAPDRTALAVTSPQAGVASALYAVQGAQSIELSIYAIFPTFATTRNGLPAPGYPAGGGTSQARRLSFSDATGRVYLKDGGWWALERDSYGDLVLNPLSTAPAGTLSAYGVTVLCSPDGNAFTAVTVSLRSAHCALEDRPGFSCYYETYSASVPTDTRYLRVELREMAAFPLADGGSVPNTARGSMRLASVTFTGNAVRGSLSGDAPSPSQPSSPAASQPSGSASGGSSTSDPDLETPLPKPDGGAAGDDDDDKSSRRSSSKSSSKRASSSSSRSASSRSSSRAASKGASPSSKASTAASAVPSREADPAPETGPWEERSAAPRASDTRTLALGGGYLVFAAVLLAAIARKK